MSIDKKFHGLKKALSPCTQNPELHYSSALPERLLRGVITVLFVYQSLVNRQCNITSHKKRIINPVVIPR
jgi:hypothetical protein